MEHLQANALPHNAIDCVILGYQNEQLKVLLLKWKFEDLWCLPGGYIYQTENFDEAAHRILAERTGLTSIYLKQFYTFGQLERSQYYRPEQVALLKKILAQIPLEGQDWDVDWFTKRFVSTGYFALVDIEQTTAQPDFLSERCAWCSVEEVPSLLADHNKILQKALEQLRIQLNYLPVGISLLPTKFTMKDLQKLYESILGVSLQRSNFQRKILKLGMLVRHEKQMTGAAHKAPYLYSFDKEKYAALVERGIGFSF
ncbi:MAG: NUDIX domain-containing protein [Bacteroidota bacterium]